MPLVDFNKVSETFSLRFLRAVDTRRDAWERHVPRKYPSPTILVPESFHPASLSRPSSKPHPQLRRATRVARAAGTSYTLVRPYPTLPLRSRPHWHHLLLQRRRATRVAAAFGTSSKLQDFSHASQNGFSLRSDTVVCHRGCRTDFEFLR
jgi:hypothetical protein